MNVYIQTDIEGVAGMTFFEKRLHGEKSVESQSHFMRMRMLLTNEVNAAATAAFDSGAVTVLINDNHGSGYNIIFEELDSRCEIIHGRNSSGPRWLPELEKGFNAMVLVGMHPMADTPFGILQHTRWVINDGEMFLSEGSMAAALAGDLDIPTVFVSGDNLLTQEMKEKIPEIEIAAVKKSIGPYMARSLMPERSCEMIYDGVQKGLERIKEIKPFKIPGPIKVNLLESKKGNHDQTAGYQRATEIDAAGPTLTEAFIDLLKQMDWTCLGVERPDGFEYP
jgi:D-amino peptidase